MEEIHLEHVIWRKPTWSEIINYKQAIGACRCSKNKDLLDGTIMMVAEGICKYCNSPVNQHGVAVQYYCHSSEELCEFCGARSCSERQEEFV